MEIACVIDKRLASLPRPGRGGGPRPGRAFISDPVAAAEATEAMVRALEGIGAAVESEQAGEAFFAVDGLRGLYGGSSAGVLAAARRALGEERRIATRRTRLAAFLRAEEWPRPVPVAALRRRLGTSEREADELTEALARLGIETLRDFARLSADQVSDRFGPLGLRALRLCHGEEEPLRPRPPHEQVAEAIELPEGTAGRQLDRALELLVDRLLAAPQRKGRTLLGLRLGALLASLLTLDRLFMADHEDGSLDLITMSRTPLELACAAKALAHWLAAGLPLIVATPVLGLLLNLDMVATGAVALTLLAGTPALTFTGMIGAALAVTLHRGGLLMAVLVLPLSIPVLIFGVAASQAVIVGPMTFGAPFSILCALSLVSLVIGPFAAAASLKHGLD